MKNKSYQFLIDKNTVTPQTLNVFNRNLNNILKIRNSIVQNLLKQIYNNLDINSNRQNIDGCIFIDHTEKLAEPLLFKEIMISQVLNQLKSDRHINGYRFSNVNKMISVFEVKDSNHTKSMENIDVSISINPKKFKQYYEKVYCKENKIEDRPILDISKFYKYLIKKPTAKQEIKLVDLFFNKNPDRYISGGYIIEMVGDIEKFSVNGGKLVSKLKKLLKDKTILTNNKGKGEWKLKL